MLIASLVVVGVVSYGLVGYLVLFGLATVESNLGSDLRKLERRRDRLKQGILD